MVMNTGYQIRLLYYIYCQRDESVAFRIYFLGHCHSPHPAVTHSLCNRELQSTEPNQRPVYNDLFGVHTPFPNLFLT